MNKAILALTIVEIIKHKAGMHRQEDHAGRGRMDRDDSNSDMESFWTGSYRDAPSHSESGSGGGGGLMARLAAKKKKEDEPGKGSLGALW